MSKILKKLKKANSKRWNSKKVLYLKYLYFFLLKIQEFFKIL